MIDNAKILILYHSGAGSTKTLAEIFYEKLSYHSVDISPISLQYDYKMLLKYDFYIFAFPTYHCDPSKSMREFLKNMPAFEEEKRAFVFTTCGLYSANAVRIFIKECSKKNIVVGGSSVYRSPASDGALMLPSFKFMYDYEKNIAVKLRRDIQKIHEIIRANSMEHHCPSFSLMSIVNFPNKVLGKAYKHRIRVIENKCIKCSKCISICIRGALKKGKEFPEFDVNKCEFCFKCIHHCPENAMVLSEKTAGKQKLSDKFYSTLKNRIIQEYEKEQL
jgi:ferredoxin